MCCIIYCSDEDIFVSLLDYFCGGAVACSHADKTRCRGLTPQPLCLKTAARCTARFKGDILQVFSIFSVLKNIACRRQRLQAVLHSVNITTVSQQGKASRLVVHDTSHMGLCAFVKERDHPSEIKYKVRAFIFTGYYP